MNFRDNDLGKKAAQKQSVLKPSFAGFLYPVSHLTLLSLGKEKQHLFPTTLNSPNWGFSMNEVRASREDGRNSASSVSACWYLCITNGYFRAIPRFISRPYRLQRLIDVQKIPRMFVVMETTSLLVEEWKGTRDIVSSPIRHSAGLQANSSIKVLSYTKSTSLLICCCFFANT